jgi:PAS domain S-box-containing protein
MLTGNNSENAQSMGLNECLAMLDRLPDVIFLADREGRFTYLNRAAKGLFNMAPDEIRGMSLWDFTPDDRKDLARTLLETSADAPWDMELDLMLPGGEKKHVRVRCAVSLNQEGERRGFEGTIRDRTAQRRLECELAESREALKESERRFHSLVEDVPDVIFSLDPEGRFTFANRRLEEITGMSGEQAVGHRLVEFVVPEDAHVMESLFNLSSDEVWDEELALYDREKNRKWLRIRARALRTPEGELVGYEGVLRDRTVRRMLEEELIASKEELLEKMKIIDELYQHIMQSQKAKVIAEHTAEVAHELRQPLAIIGGFARRMESQLCECRKLDVSAQRDCFHVIVREVQRLEKILGGLIEYSRQHSVQLAPTDPHALIEEALHVNEERFREKEIDVDLKLSPEVDRAPLDPDRFTQVIRNLVANAFEASPPKGVIKISTAVFSPTEKERRSAGLEAESYFEMKIANGGRPIPEHEIHKIFDPFFTTKEYGTGVGLTVTKKIVEDHKGSIGVKSDGSGTVVTVWIPMNPGDSDMRSPSA